MVIEIKSIGCIEDLKKVPDQLGFIKGTKHHSDSFVFDDKNMTCFAFFQLDTDDNWLNVVCYSLSTKSGTLAFAHRRKIIVLSNQWDSKLQQFKYSIVWSGEIDGTVDSEITALACLTVTSEQNEVSDCAKWMRLFMTTQSTLSFSRPPIARVSWSACRRDICYF